MDEDGSCGARAGARRRLTARAGWIRPGTVATQGAATGTARKNPFFQSGPGAGAGDPAEVAQPAPAAQGGLWGGSAVGGAAASAPVSAGSLPPLQLLLHACVGGGPWPRSSSSLACSSVAVCSSSASCCAGRGSGGLTPAEKNRRRSRR